MSSEPGKSVDYDVIELIDVLTVLIKRIEKPSHHFVGISSIFNRENCRLHSNIGTVTNTSPPRSTKTKLLKQKQTRMRILLLKHKYKLSRTDKEEV